MNSSDQLIQEVGQEVLKAELLEEFEWNTLTLVVEVGDGYFSDSGFLYCDDDIEPFDAESDDPLALRNIVIKLRDALHQSSGQYFKQLLIQIEKKSGRLKIDFEFDNASRWSITPANLRVMRDQLRPDFD